MYYIGNAFSLQMLQVDSMTNLSVTPVLEPSDILSDAYMCGECMATGLSSGDTFCPSCGGEYIVPRFTSAIGHQDTANVVSSILGITIPCNRINISLNQGDVLIVAQVVGGRLPEGAITLPDGFRLQFFRVEIV
ncbi:MAG: STIV orfB116 family protein [Halanaerobiales bacterium]